MHCSDEHLLSNRVLIQPFQVVACQQVPCGVWMPSGRPDIISIVHYPRFAFQVFTHMDIDPDCTLITYPVVHNIPTVLTRVPIPTAIGCTTGV